MRKLDSHEIVTNTIFISTDATTSDQLFTFDSSVKVYTKVFEQTNADQQYGQLGYFRLILERLKVQRVLLENGVSFMNIEGDQIWFSSKAMTSLLQAKFKKSDVVAYDDTGTKLICCGFLGIASTPAILKFFGPYVEQYADIIRRMGSNDAKQVADGGNEQFILTKGLKKNKIEVSWFDPCTVMRGQWYTSGSLRRECPNPWMLHNNWIVGNGRKVERAKKVAALVFE